jgi:hypothetical protein
LAIYSNRIGIRFRSIRSPLNIIWVLLLSNKQQRLLNKDRFNITRQILLSLRRSIHSKHWFMIHLLNKWFLCTRYQYDHCLCQCIAQRWKVTIFLVLWVIGNPRIIGGSNRQTVLRIFLILLLQVTQEKTHCACFKTSYFGGKCVPR